MKEIVHACFSDGTPMKKWHRVLLTHVCYFGLSKQQAREAIALNPYLAKHKDDFDRVFEECKSSFVVPVRENPRALKDYIKHFGLEGYAN